MKANDLINYQGAAGFIAGFEDEFPIVHIPMGKQISRVLVEEKDLVPLTGMREHSIALAALADHYEHRLVLLDSSTRTCLKWRCQNCQRIFSVSESEEGKVEIEGPFTTICP